MTGKRVGKCIFSAFLLLMALGFAASPLCAMIINPFQIVKVDKRNNHDPYVASSGYVQKVDRADKLNPSVTQPGSQPGYVKKMNRNDNLDPGVMQAVYIKNANSKYASIYIEGNLHKKVKIVNFNTNYTYDGVMEASSYNKKENSIFLYNTIPATSYVDYSYDIVSHTEGSTPFDQTTVIDSMTIVDDTIAVNGTDYAVSDDVKYYTIGSNGNAIELADFQIALCRYVDKNAYLTGDDNYEADYALPEYSAASVYINNSDEVEAIYYFNMDTPYPTSDEYTYGETTDIDSNDSTKGAVGLNEYAVVSQSGVFGVYDADLSLVNYLSGMNTNSFSMQDYTGLSACEVVNEYMPAIEPFIHYAKTANPDVNLSQSISIKNMTITVEDGAVNTTALLANGGKSEIGYATITSGSSLDSDIISNTLNTYTEYDEWDNAAELSGASNNNDYFNVKTNEIGSQWGVNAIVYAINGGEIYIGDKDHRSSIIATESSNTANLAWATTLGSKIYITNADMIGYASAAHATDVTYGGYIHVEDCYMETMSGTSSILTTDFGGGTVDAKNITGIAHSQGSAGAYIEGGGWTKVDNSDWSAQIFTSSEEAIAFLTTLNDEEDWGEEGLQEEYRGTNLLYAVADGGACISHFGWVEYNTVNTAGAYGVLIMNRASNDDLSTSLYGHYLLTNGSLTSYGSGNKTNCAGDTYTAAIAFFGGAAYARVDNSLVTINTTENQDNYLVYAATNSFMSYNFDADGFLEFVDENGEKALVGDIAADAGVDTANKVDITFTNSEWSGMAQATNSGTAGYDYNGEITLTFDASSVWNVTETSSVSSLTVEDGAEINGTVTAENTVDNGNGSTSYINATVSPL